jgi:hypothetical protein
MIPGLAEVAKLAPRQIEQAASGVQLFQELGGFTGRLLFALLVVRIVSQRRRLRLVLGPAVFVFAWLYFFAATRSLALVHVGIFLATMLFNALHSFWGNYLPRVYPTRLRGTGESFAANIGGRVFGVSAVLITTTLSNVMPGSGPGARLATSQGTSSKQTKGCEYEQGRKNYQTAASSGRSSTCRGCLPCPMGLCVNIGKSMKIWVQLGYS